MGKHELLQSITQLSSSGELSKEEVLSAFSTGQGSVAEESKHLNLSQVLYYIGGAIVFIGICVLIFQNWDYFTTAVKILVTLGVAIAAYIVGALFNRYPNYQGVGLAFFLISALVTPIGFYVLFNQLGLDTASAAIGLLVYLIAFVAFLASYFAFRQIIFTLFSIIFGTGVFFFLVQWLVGNNLASADLSKILEYQILVTGLAYMFLGYYFKQTTQRALTGVLYAFGALGFLGAAIFLGGWQPNQSAFWELIYPLLVFGIIFLSVYIKSKSFLVFGSLFLIGYILKLTAEYFSSGLGWPTALVLAGLVIIVVGYYAVKLNKKYLTTVRIK